MTINERVRYLRKDVLKLSQTEFGHLVGVDQRLISAVEQGQRRATDRNVEAICREWNVRREWLLTGEGEVFSPARPATVREELLNEPKRLDRELAAALAALDDVQLKAFKRQFSSPR